VARGRHGAASETFSTGTPARHNGQSPGVHIPNDSCAIPSNARPFSAAKWAASSPNKNNAPQRHGSRATGQQIGVSSAGRRTGAHRVIHDGDGFAPHVFAQGRRDAIADGKEAGRAGTLESHGEKIRNSQLGCDRLRELRPAGLGSADRVDSVPRQTFRQFGHKRSERFRMLENPVEFEPPLAVKTGFHLEMTLASGEQVDEFLCMMSVEATRTGGIWRAHKIRARR